MKAYIFNVDMRFIPYLLTADKSGLSSRRAIIYADIGNEKRYIC